MQEEMGLIAMRVFEKLLARESAEGTIDGSSQIERASCDVSAEPGCLPVVVYLKINTTSRVVCSRRALSLSLALLSFS